jgi:hypothetical protein
MRIVIPEDRPRYEMTLNDGSILTLSPILKTDRDFFEQGIRELSLESRFSRFGRGVGSFTDSELDWNTPRAHITAEQVIAGEVLWVGTEQPRLRTSEDGPPPVRGLGNAKPRRFGREQDE